MFVGAVELNCEEGEMDKIGAFKLEEVAPQSYSNAADVRAAVEFLSK